LLYPLRLLRKLSFFMLFPQREAETFPTGSSLPFNLSSFAIDEAKVRGHFLKVACTKEGGLELFVDAILKAKLKELKALKMNL